MFQSGKKVEVARAKDKNGKDNGRNDMTFLLSLSS